MLEARVLSETTSASFENVNPTNSAIRGQTGPEFVHLLEGMLHIRAGERMDSDGNYPSPRGHRCILSLGNFEAHLRGEDPNECWAFCSTYRGKANFLAFDVDSRFDERMPILVLMLKKRCLEKGAFITTGSSEGKGKVIIVLERPIPQATANETLQSILRDARNHNPSLFPVQESRIDLRPTKVGQSLLRIGGKHRTKGLRPDRFLDVDGHALVPNTVKPVSLSLLLGEQPIEIRGKQAALRFVGRLLQGVMKTDDYVQIRICLMRLAHEAVRLRGASEGRILFAAWVQSIVINSPETKSKVTRAMQGLYDAVLVERKKQLDNYKSIITFVPTPQGGKRSDILTPRLLEVMLHYAIANGLNPLTGFTISQRQLGDFLGKSQPQISSLIKKAMKLGRLIRPHLGTRGSYGLAAMYALVKPDENKVDALHRCYRSHLFKEQCNKVTKYLAASQTTPEQALPEAA